MLRASEMVRRSGVGGWVDLLPRPVADQHGQNEYKQNHKDLAYTSTHCLLKVIAQSKTFALAPAFSVLPVLLVAHRTHLLFT